MLTEESREQIREAQVVQAFQNSKYFIDIFDFLPVR